MVMVGYVIRNWPLTYRDGCWMIRTCVKCRWKKTRGNNYLLLFLACCILTWDRITNSCRRCGPNHKFMPSMEPFFTRRESIYNNIDKRFVQIFFNTWLNVGVLSIAGDNDSLQLYDFTSSVALLLVSFIKKKDRQ